LRQAGFDVDRPTAWIAEGLLHYLAPDAKQRLLENITTLSAEGSRLALDTYPRWRPPNRTTSGSESGCSSSAGRTTASTST